MKPQPTIVEPAMSKVAARSDRVARVLKALGHPEAFVTDESTIGDFLPIFGSSTDRVRWLDGVQAKLAMDVRLQDFLWQVAEKLP